MLIRSQLRLAVLLPLLFALLICGFLWFAALSIYKAQQDAEVAEKVLHINFELSILAQEYLIVGASPNQSQLRIHQQLMGELLAQLNFEENREQELIVAMQRDLRELGGFQESLTGINTQSREQIVRALLAKAQDMRIKAQQLADIERRQNVEQVRRANILVAAALALLVALGMIYLTQLARRLVRGIMKLNNGVRLITDGDFEQQIVIETMDEFGELAHSFNKMSRQLQSSYVSISNLQDEVAYRLVIEQDLAQSEARSRQLIDQAPYAMVSCDATGNIVGWNLAAERIFGYGAEEVLRQPVIRLIPVRYRDAHQEGMHRVQAGGERHAIGKTVELHGLNKAGREFPIALSLSVWWTEEGQFFTAIIRDITAHWEAQQKIERLTRFYSALSQCNKAITSTVNEENLLRQICRIAVDAAGMKLAWIGKVAATGRDVLQVESYGEGKDYLCGIRTLLAADDPEGCGPVGTAVRENQPIWCQDFLHDPITAPWHERAAQFGLAAAAALPLCRDGVVIGAFSLYAGEPNAFDEQVQELLLEMAADINHALDNYALEAERREREQQLKILSRVVEQSPVSIVIADLKGNIEYVNPKFERVTGFGSADVIGQNPRVLSSHEKPVEEYREMWATLNSGKTWQGEFHNRRKDGTLFWEYATISPILDEQGRTINFVAIKEDITGRKASEAEIQRLAYFDALTELPNRRLLVDRLAHALASSTRSRRGGALLFIDLDDFKSLNDTVGHEVGDQLLQQVARRLATCVRDGDTVARLGGDEFVVLLDNLAELPTDAATQAEAVGEKILATLRQPHLLAGHEYRGTASIGITLFADQSDTVDELLRRADLAMYQAKAAGRNTLRFFDPQMQAMILARVDLVTELGQAMAENQFLLHYQPKVSCVSGRVTGFEALLRWQHPLRGLVLPDEFIPALEETGLIVPVGAWVMASACAQAKRWQDEGLGTPTIAVNVSGRQIYVGDLCATVRAALAASGLSPACLELELTESQLMQDAEAIIHLLGQLKEIGVLVSVDDFGTGYSSLAYLKRFPIDSLKVDRAFVRDIIADPNDVSITRAIITLAHSLKLKVVAEGVETEGQLGLLIANHCDEIQGYYFSRPLPAAEATTLLASGRSLDSQMMASLVKTRTLLLVDDEENILSALKRLLRRDGYQILTAAGAEAGLEVLARHPVDVIVSDQRMPGMSGVEFLRRVKTLHPETVRLVLSGYTDLQAVTDAINEGAIYKFLTKPWDDGILRANIEEAFRHKEMADENRRLHIEVALSNSQMARVNEQLTKLLATKDLQVLRDEAALDIAQEVLQQLPWPIIGIDDEGTVALANAAAVQLCGDAAPLLGRAMDACLPEPLAAALAASPSAEADIEIAGVPYHLCRRSMGEHSRSRGTLIILQPS